MRQSNANGESNCHIHADSYTNCDGDSNGYAYTHSYADGHSNSYAYTDSYANGDSNGYAYTDGYTNGNSNSNSDGYCNCDQTAATYADATATADTAAACKQLL
jgi:hypothetical protein